jgi:uncharacterized membrane protein
MDTIAVLLLLVLFIMILLLRNNLFERLDKLEREIVKLREQKTAAPIASPPPVAAPPPIIPPVALPQPVVQETEPYKPIERPRPQPFGQPAPGPVEPATTPREVKVIEPPHFQRMDEAKSPPPPKPDFFDRHPDLEKFIGENLISKIGIAVLVLAIGYFVKYAIDNDWIAPVGRVAVGLVCGGILIGIAHRLRNQYKAFSSVLVGGGLAVLYFTIALAYHQYQLFNQPTAFVIMLVVTAFSVLLSHLYDRQELAIIALAGGFVTPFLVSNGNGNYVVLFSYLLILNSGLLVIAYNKLWRLLNILSFGFTAVLFATWLLSLPYDALAPTYRGGWEFATAFYLLFFLINIAYTIRKSKVFIASDFAILLANTSLYFAAGLYFIAQLGLDRYKGLFCAGMGVFHLGATAFLFRKITVDKNILYLLVGLTLSFVSLTAPIQLHGHYITLFWASEAVLLYWLFIRSKINLIHVAAMLVWGAMLISLLMDWMARPVSLPVFFNKTMMTGLYATISCWAIFYLRPEVLWGKIALIVAAALFFIAGLQEVYFQFAFYYPTVAIWILYDLLFAYLVLAGYSWGAGKLRSLQIFRPTSGWLYAAGILLYLATLDAVFNLQEYLLERALPGGHFFAHWVGDGIVALILFRLITKGRQQRLMIQPMLFTWLICLVIVIFLTAEGQLLVNTVFFSQKNGLDELTRVYTKTVMPILWGLCSFAFMSIGMRYKFKPLRIVSLVLFTLTLFKLFFFDIQNIPIAGKIAAFFCLGVLLLVVSFMYQRLKKIIIEDEEKKPL